MVFVLLFKKPFVSHGVSRETRLAFPWLSTITLVLNRKKEVRQADQSQGHNFTLVWDGHRRFGS